MDATIATIARLRIFGNGGVNRVRTCDLLIANETLYQLSYDPIHQERRLLWPNCFSNQVELSSAADLFPIPGFSIADIAPKALYSH
jgi:hypothetical protein